MRNDHVRSCWRGFGALGVACAIVACDNPVSPGEDHAEPAGFVVWLGDEMVLAVDEAGDIEPESGLFVPLGGETGVLRFEFVDEHGDALEHESNEFLKVVPATPVRVEFIPEPDDLFAGRLRGLANGPTSIEVSLEHGTPAASHPDYGPVTVPVVLVAPT